MPNGAGGVAGWPVADFLLGPGYDAVTLAGANAVDVRGIVIPYSCTFSNISVSVLVADNTNPQDFGLYTKAGALIANTGPTVFGSTAFLTKPTLQGVQTIAPGMYLFAWTSSTTLLQIPYDHTTPVWVKNTNIATSSSSTLPASIGAVTASPSQGTPCICLS